MQVRVGGHLLHVASVSKGTEVEFADPNDGLASEHVLAASAGFAFSLG